MAIAQSSLPMILSKINMDPVVYATYLYFLIVLEKRDDEDDEEALKRIQATHKILNIAKQPQYKERMIEMFERIGTNRALLSTIEDI